MYNVTCSFKLTSKTVIIVPVGNTVGQDVLKIPKPIFLNNIFYKLFNYRLF